MLPKSSCFKAFTPFFKKIFKSFTQRFKIPKTSPFRAILLHPFAKGCDALNAYRASIEATDFERNVYFPILMNHHLLQQRRHVAD
jgi:hypothetical protein